MAGKTVAGAYVRVAFPVPLAETFWYRNCPDKPARAGCRVEATLGRRKLAGFALESAGMSPEDLPAGLAGLESSRIKTLIRSIDAEPLFDQASIDLASWISRMYFCSQGEALGAMLPGGRRESAQISTEMEDFVVGDKALPLSDEQREALEAILGGDRGGDRSGGGNAGGEPVGIEPASGGGNAGGGTTYLYGSTGTGKTEVFLQAAEASLAAGRGVIYLVPEIALTGQVVRSARKRFGDTCAVIHSRLTPSQKLAEWRRILSGEARMVIGARSAIFAPVGALGLIVIDEEHESSYKAGNSPRYHARQVAMYRAGREGAKLVLGSATPSVEAWEACASGSMQRRVLARRPGGGAFPSIEVIDMRTENSAISVTLADALRATKEEGRQSILFLNRRGFSHFFSCNTCGAELQCRHCSVGLTWHREQNQLVCHYCGYRRAAPEACPECGSLDTGWKGFGTERIEAEVSALFPDWRIRRLDADSTSRKGSLEKVLEEFRRGEVDVLLGTQMVAKGLNFPGVKTVGVVLADAGLNLPDFRASERVFSLIVQVAGRAGRYDPDGRVYLQTFRPDNPVIRLAAALDLEGFHARERIMRQAQGFPPFSRLARLVVRAPDRDLCIAAARDLAGRRQVLQKSVGMPATAGGGTGGRAGAPEQVQLLGPAECALSMVAGSHRWQILLRASGLGSLNRAVHSLVDGWSPPSGVHLEIDIDPVQLL